MTLTALEFSRGTELFHRLDEVLRGKVKEFPLQWSATLLHVVLEAGHGICNSARVREAER